jgi:hypothetical protein
MMIAFCVENFEKKEEEEKKKQQLLLSQGVHTWMHIRTCRALSVF